MILNVIPIAQHPQKYMSALVAKVPYISELHVIVLGESSSRNITLTEDSAQDSNVVSPGVSP